MASNTINIDLERGHTDASEGEYGTPRVSGYRSGARVLRKHEGLLNTSRYQKLEPERRLVQLFAGAASVTQWVMEQEMNTAWVNFKRAYRRGNKKKWMQKARIIRRKMPEFYDFLNSRIGVEALQRPSKAAFRRFSAHFPSLREDGFPVEGHPTAWRCLRKPSRQEEWARALSEGGKFRQFFLKPLLNFARISDIQDDAGQEGRGDGDKYRFTTTKIIVGMLWCIPLGLFFCTPVVIMAGGWAPQAVNIALICWFVIASGVLISWMVPDPILPVMVMVAYSAVLVSIDVKGYQAPLTANL